MKLPGELGIFPKDRCPVLCTPKNSRDQKDPQIGISKARVVSFGGGKVPVVTGFPRPIVSSKVRARSLPFKHFRSAW